MLVLHAEQEYSAQAAAIALSCLLSVPNLVLQETVEIVHGSERPLEVVTVGCDVSNTCFASINFKNPWQDIGPRGMHARMFLRGFNGKVGLRYPLMVHQIQHVAIVILMKVAN